ncbi:hypothetical protein AAMO2058_000425500 [Amorphochlora amoebiformis]
MAFLALWVMVMASLASASPFRAVVCDAGSTGTRLYIYSLDENGKMTSITGKKSKPGLSAVDPADAAEYLIPLIENAEHLLGKDHEALPIYVIGTAGMRLLDQNMQQKIYRAAATNLPALLKKKKLNFSVKLQNFRTASGQEEGYWGFLAANFLQERIGSKLTGVGDSSNLTGVLDLGGSSTQISYKCSTSETEPIQKEDMFTHSFLGFGARLARHKVWSTFVEKNPCGFQGQVSIVKGKQQTLLGTGESAVCRSAIEKVLLDNSTCSRADSCYFANVPKPKTSSCGEFLAISLYFYAMDCLRHVSILLSKKEDLSPAKLTQLRSFTSAWPSPSIKEIEAAGEVFCSQTYTKATKWEHKETPKDDLDGRCFEVNYIAALLRAYDVSEDAHLVSFVKDAKGSEVEWTLGVFLEENLNVQSVYPNVTFNVFEESSTIEMEAENGFALLYVMLALALFGLMLVVAKITTNRSVLSLLSAPMEFIIVPDIPQISEVSGEDKPHEVEMVTQTQLQQA